MAHYDTIFFDFDSTLVTIETFDHLAERVGLGAEVSEMTRKSMNGEVPLSEVFEKKINLVAPKRSLVEEIAEECKTYIVEGAQEVVNALKQQGKQVYVVSSGLRQIIEPTSIALGFSPDHIIANDIFFNDDGSYAGMSADSPLCTDGGKAQMVTPIAQKSNGCVFVGDSASDLLCQDVVNLFIGFGGVVEREKVQNEAQVYISNQNLTAILPFIG